MPATITKRKNLSKLRDTRKPVIKHDAVEQNQRANSREKEMNWIATHQEDINSYRGEWIVIEGNRLISHNRNYLKAISDSKTKGIQIPFVLFIPEENLPFVGI